MPACNRARSAWSRVATMLRLWNWSTDHRLRWLCLHLGGRCEPVGDDFAGSTIEFKTGRELIPGLA